MNATARSLFQHSFRSDYLATGDQPLKTSTTLGHVPQQTVFSPDEDATVISPVSPGIEVSSPLLHGSNGSRRGFVEDTFPALPYLGFANFNVPPPPGFFISRPTCTGTPPKFEGAYQPAPMLGSVAVFGQPSPGSMEDSFPSFLFPGVIGDSISKQPGRLPDDPAPLTGVKRHDLKPGLDQPELTPGLDRPFDSPPEFEAGDGDADNHDDYLLAAILSQRQEQERQESIKSYMKPCASAALMTGLQTTPGSLTIMLERIYQWKKRSLAAGYFKQTKIPIISPRRIIFDSHSDVLGKGSFGQAISGWLYQGEGRFKRIVVKTCFTAKSTPDRFVREAKMHLAVGDCRALPQFHGLVPVFWRDLHPFGLVMEKVGNGTTLHDLFYATPGPTMEEWIHICYLLAKNLAAIHSKGILHNDLKKDNVVIFETPDGYEVVIIDLGNSSLIGESIAYNSITSDNKKDPLYFLAPEIKDGFKCSLAGDVWSLGILISKIMTFQGIPDLEIITILCLQQRPHLRATASSTQAWLRGLLEEIGAFQYIIQTTTPDSDEQENETCLVELEEANLVEVMGGPGGPQILPNDDPFVTQKITELSTSCLIQWQEKPPTASARWRPMKNALDQELVNVICLGDPSPLICATRKSGPLTYKESFMYESRIYSFLTDTNVTPTFYGLKLKNYPVQLFEYLDGSMTLGEFIRIGPHLSKEEWINLAFKICQKVWVLHQRGFVVNSIKDTKILVDCQYEPYFVDLAFASYKKGHRYLSYQTKQMHLAPEVRRGLQTSQQADIYSIGYILRHIMMKGKCLTLQETIGCCLQECKDSRPNVDTVLTMLDDALLSLQL
jgi:serine/threonine protein kinase